MMNTLTKIGLAATALCGVALSAASPASAREWRGDGDYGRYERNWDRGDRHDGWREGRRDGWGEGREWRGGYGYHRPYYGWRDGCAAYWRWDDWQGRYVRITRCY